MTRRRVLTAAGVTTALCAFVLGAVICPAQAMTDTIAGTAHPMKYPAEIDAILEIGSQLIAASPPIPPAAKKMAVTIKTKKQEEAEAAVDMLVSLAVLSPRKRWATCAIIAYNANTTVQSMSQNGYPQSALAYNQTAKNAVSLCVQATVLLHSAGANTSPTQVTNRAAQKCGVATVTFPVSSNDLGLTVTGPPIPTRSPLRVSCRQSDGNMALTVKTKSKKTTLTKVLGGPLPLGIASSPQASTPVDLTIGYSQPR